MPRIRFCLHLKFRTSKFLQLIPEMLQAHSRAWRVRRRARKLAALKRAVFGLGCAAGARVLDPRIRAATVVQANVRR